MKKIGKLRPEIPVDLGDGASIVFRTAKRSVGMVAARRAAGLMIEAGGDAADASVAFTVALASKAAISWEGVSDLNGEPLELSEENLELLMTDDPEAYRRIDQQFVMLVLDLDAEKNASAPSPAGAMPAGALTENSATLGAVETTAPPVPTSATSAPTS